MKQQNQRFVFNSVRIFLFVETAYITHDAIWLLSEVCVFFRWCFPYTVYKRSTWTLGVKGEAWNLHPFQQPVGGSDSGRKKQAKKDSMET